MARTVKTRLPEYARYLKSGLYSKSAVAKHQHQTGHQIVFEITSVIAILFTFPGKFVSLLRLLINNFNRETGYSLPPI